MSRVTSRSAPGGRAPLRTPAKPPRPVADRPGRLAILWRRHWRRGALVLLAVVAVVGVAALARTLHPANTILSWRERAGGLFGFTVQAIVIEGRDKTPEPMLRAALGVRRGDKLLGISLEGARARIEALSWVQRATVERRLPGTIVVTLQERRPFAVWQSNGKFVLIDRAGNAVVDQDPEQDAAVFASLPLVVGAGAPQAAAGLIDQLAAQPELRSRVVAAIRIGERRWNLRLGNGADVLLPEGAAGAAIAKLAELQASQQLLDRPLQLLDLRLADRLVVRPLPEPPLPLPPKRPT